MSGWEEVPDAAEAAEMERDDELDTYMEDVYNDLRTAHRERRFHDRNGYLCDFAGDRSCLALGHKPDPECGWEEDDEHPEGWGGNPICPATKYDVACSQCESDDCEGAELLAMSTRNELWALVAKSPTSDAKGTP